MGIFDWLVGKNKTNSDSKETKNVEKKIEEEETTEETVAENTETETEKEKKERVKKNKELIANFAKKTLESKENPRELMIIEEVLKDFISKMKHADLPEEERNYIIPEFEKLLEEVNKYK